MNYKYITEDDLENKQTYMYSEYDDFLMVYARLREEVISS